MADQEQYRANAKYRRIMKKLDKNCAETDSQYPIAVLLIAAASVGTKADALAKETGYPRAFTRKLRAKIGANDVFRGGKIVAGDWFGKDGGIAFWLDVACASGLLRRVRV